MKRVKFNKIIILAVIYCLGVFFMLELATRLYLLYDGKGFFRDRRFISPFFTIYDPPAPVEKNGVLLFKRGQRVSKIPSSNTVRIICLGGSTTVSQNTKNHYPQLLQEKLNKIYKNIRFEVLNAGADAFSSAHSLVNFALRIIYFHPDCIIIYHNINDLSANYFSNEVSSDYSEKYLNNLYLAPECKLGIQGPFFKFRLISYFLMHLNNAVFQKRAMRLGSIDISRGKEIFKNNLTNIILIAKERNIKVVLGVQPACFSKAKKYSFIRKSDFLEYNDVVREIAKEKKVYLADCYQALGEDEQYFSDRVHYTEKGVDKVSDAFLQEIMRIYPDSNIQKYE